MAAIKIDDLTNEIVKSLKEYNSKVEKDLEKAKHKTALDGAKELRSTSPQRTGAYARDWASKKEGTNYVIYNRKHYQLTHLLEFGHAKKNGGRVPGNPHIAPVEQHAIVEFEQQVEKELKG